MSITDPSALARRLIVAANELLATAYELGGRLGGARGEAGAEERAEGSLQDDPLSLAVARQAYRDRRRREEIFGGDLFGEPAWDILLDLFIAAKEAKRISITSACIGAAAPSTTALRWLNILEREGLIEREGDSNDLRRSYVRLTAVGYARMIEFFGEGSMGASDRNGAEANGFGASLAERRRNPEGREARGPRVA